MAPVADALAGLTPTIEDTVADGARVAVSATATATLTREFYGVPPTGGRTGWALVAFAGVGDGRVVETRIRRDGFGIVERLDRTPSPRSEHVRPVGGFVFAPYPHPPPVATKSRSWAAFNRWRSIRSDAFDNRRAVDRGMLTPITSTITY